MKKRLITFLIAFIIVGTVFVYYQFLMFNDIFNFRPISPSLPDGYSYGLWVWQSPSDMSSSRINDLLAFSQAQKINTLFVDISKYIDLYELPDSPSRTQQLSDFENSWVNFIKLAHSSNLKVEALAGNTRWGNSTHEYIPMDILKYLTDFNTRHPDASFSGVQYDIEFYNQPDFSDDKSTHTLDYLNTVSDLVRLKNQLMPGNTTFHLGMALPPSMSGNNVAPAIWWGSDAKPVMFKVSDILSRTTGGYIVLMSYRKLPGGVNGTISISRSTLEYLTSHTPNVFTLIGQETTQVDPSSITFWGTNKSTLKTAAISIIDYFKNNSSFKGMAFHDSDGFMALQDN